MANPSKRKGTEWERRVADYAAEQGLPWDRAPLRGSRDLLDIQGCLPDGWLVGAKALSDANLADRLSRAMTEARNAVGRLTRPDGVRTVQIVQRRGFPVGRAYAVMEYDQLLDIIVALRKPKRQRRPRKPAADQSASDHQTESREATQSE